jgi:hypothetical protein
LDPFESWLTADERGAALQMFAEQASVQILTLLDSEARKMECQNPGLTKARAGFIFLDINIISKYFFLDSY